MRVSQTLVSESELLQTFCDEDMQPTSGYIDLEVCLPFPSSMLSYVEQVLVGLSSGVTEQTFFQKDENVASLPDLLEVASFLQMHNLTLFLKKGLNHLCKHGDPRLDPFTKRNKRVNLFWLGDQSVLNIASKVWLKLQAAPRKIENMDNSCFSSRSMIRSCRISVEKYWKDIVHNTDDEYLALFISDFIGHHCDEALNMCVATGKLKTMDMLYSLRTQKMIENGYTSTLTSNTRAIMIVDEFSKRAKAACFTAVLDWLKSKGWEDDKEFFSYIYLDVSLCDLDRILARFVER
jgi:hypothetical protein